MSIALLFFASYLLHSPPEVIFMSKKLGDIAPIDAVLRGGVELRFQDDSVERADTLIDADGIFCYVRKFVIGVDHAARESVFAGW